MLDAPRWAVELLATARVARLATSGTDGQPLVVPVCYVVDGDRLYWAVDAKPKRTRELRRLRDIAANPRVSLVVDVWDEDWRRLRWVRVDGTATALVEGDERTRALAALTAKYPQYATMQLATVAGAVIAITPARAMAWRGDEETA
ncbi:MAG: TIGR03668 family PPOX class F420-dependent oxidoreductase [Candidatus Rokubacteria bacterium]|nr:TIGR03668 family PPOX class F420-dependent oxidoreductase [Candidatus Rokubacteria bacterium]